MIDFKKLETSYSSVERRPLRGFNLCIHSMTIVMGEAAARKDMGNFWKYIIFFLLYSASYINTIPHQLKSSFHRICVCGNIGPQYRLTIEMWSVEGWAFGPSLKSLQDLRENSFDQAVGYMSNVAKAAALI